MFKIFSLIVFAISFVVIFQAIIWRIPCLHPSLRTLLVLLIIAPCFLFFIAHFLSSSFFILSPLEWIAASFYYMATCLCYLITFTGIESDSPTLSLLLQLNKYKTMTQQQMTDFLIKHLTVQDRFDSMLANGFLIKENRLLSKLADADEVQGADGAQKLSVYNILDTPSTSATPQFAASVEFRNKSNEIVRLPKKQFLVFRIILWYRKTVLGITNFGG